MKIPHNFDRKRYGNILNKDVIFLTCPLHQSLGGATLCVFFGINRFNMLNPFEIYISAEAAVLNTYIGRMNTVLAGSVMTSGVGLFYPIATMPDLFTANKTEAEIAFTFRFGDGVGFHVYNPVTREITDHAGKTELNCAAYRGLFLVTDEICATARKKDL